MWVVLTLARRYCLKRVKNCNRPGDAVDITMEDAQEILYRYKEAMEESWVEGWDNDQAGQVQFVGFFDDSGDVVGSTGRMLEEISLDNTRLTSIAIGLIAVFSAACLFSFDLVESRVLVTLIGVLLVVISYFAALGFSLLLGIKINVVSPNAQSQYHLNVINNLCKNRQWHGLYPLSSLDLASMMFTSYFLR